MDYSEGPTTLGKACVARNSTVTEALEARVAGLEAQLAEAKSALALLKQHPETQQVLDALSRLNIR